MEFTFHNSYVILELVPSTYSTFMDRAQLLTEMLLEQGYVALKSSLQKFYCCHHNLVDRYGISISQMTMDRLLFTYASFPLSQPKLLPDLTVNITLTNNNFESLTCGFFCLFQNNYVIRKCHVINSEKTLLNVKGKCQKRKVTV